MASTSSSPSAAAAAQKFEIDLNDLQVSMNTRIIGKSALAALAAPLMDLDIDSYLYETNPNTVRTVVRNVMPLILLRRDLSAVVNRHAAEITQMSQTRGAPPPALSKPERILLAKSGTSLAKMIAHICAQVRPTVHALAFAVMCTRCLIETPSELTRVQRHLLLRVSDVLPGMFSEVNADGKPVDDKTAKDAPRALQVVNCVPYLVMMDMELFEEKGIKEMPALVTAYKKALHHQLMCMQASHLLDVYFVLKRLQQVAIPEEVVTAHKLFHVTFSPFFEDDECTRIKINVHASALSDAVTHISRSLHATSRRALEEHSAAKILDDIVVEATSEMAACLAGSRDERKAARAQSVSPGSIVAAALVERVGAPSTATSVSVAGEGGDFPDLLDRLRAGDAPATPHPRAPAASVQAQGIDADNK